MDGGGCTNEVSFPYPFPLSSALPFTLFTHQYNGCIWGWVKMSWVTFRLRDQSKRCIHPPPVPFSVLFSFIISLSSYLQSNSRNLEMIGRKRPEEERRHEESEGILPHPVFPEGGMPIMWTKVRWERPFLFHLEIICGLPSLALARSFVNMM